MIQTYIRIDNVEEYLEIIEIFEKHNIKNKNRKDSVDFYETVISIYKNMNRSIYVNYSKDFKEFSLAAIQNNNIDSYNSNKNVNMYTFQEYLTKYRLNILNKNLDKLEKNLN